MTDVERGGVVPPNPAVVLLAGASPRDRAELAIDAEFDAIEASIRQGSHREFLRVVLSHETEAAELIEKMLDDDPTVVHFAGHGTEFDELLFETADGTAAAVDADVLSRMFGAFTGVVRCVVLCACYSDAQAAAVANHVDCVIGMSDRFSDAASHTFAASFYRSLASGRDVATAFDLAVVHIDLAGIPESKTPALFGRERAAMLRFDGGAAPAAVGIPADREMLGRELYDEHYLSLVRLASSVIDSVSVCEGVVQEAFVKFLQADPADAGEDGLTLLRRLVLEVAASRRSLQPGLPQPPSAPNVVDAPDEVTAVLRAIRTLASSDANALVLDRLQRLSAEEISTTLGDDPDAVANAVTSAISTVTALLGERS
ncbi:MAG: CHAT domain-containing protein [Ilumatobacter sp.]|nr:CHAT domain-containing protein [Ilumatobacter sp.]